VEYLREGFQESEIEGVASPYPRPLTRAYDISFAISRGRVAEILIARGLAICAITLLILAASLIPFVKQSPQTFWLATILGVILGLIAWQVAKPSQQFDEHEMNVHEWSTSEIERTKPTKLLGLSKLFVVHSGRGAQSIWPFKMEHDLGISSGLFKLLSREQILAVAAFLPVRIYMIYAFIATNSTIGLAYHSSKQIGWSHFTEDVRFGLQLVFCTLACFGTRALFVGNMKRAGLWGPYLEALHIRRELSRRLPWYIRPIADLRFGIRSPQNVEKL
jgi:hypothetical protein